jgi:EpsI family protein
MTAMRMKALIVFVLLALAAGGAALWRPKIHLADTKPKVELEQIFPQQFGDWVVDRSGPVQLVSPDQAAVLNKIYNQTLSRTYINRKGDRVMLSVAYGGDQSDGTRAHRPDVCYPAQGFEVLRKSTSTVELTNDRLPVQTMVARLGGRIEPVTYWFVVGDRLVLSGTDQKLAQLSFGTRGVIPDGLLMRVSTIDSNINRSYAVQAEFLRDMHQGISNSWRTQIFGAQRRA